MGLGRHWITAFWITGWCSQAVLCSYLGYPRINFAGHFRTDPTTRNNDYCNYRLNKPTNTDLDLVDYSANGTNEFEFFDAHVTSVLNLEGDVVEEDPLVGQEVVGNAETGDLMAKISDQGSYEHPTVYGVRFGVAWEGSDRLDKARDMALYGKWTRHTIAQYNWVRIPCYSQNNTGGPEVSFQDTHVTGVISTTTITDLDWGQDLRGSEVLAQLKERAITLGRNLQARITLQFFTRNFAPYVAFNATLGYVTGSIGVAGGDSEEQGEEESAFNVPGQRAMFPRETPVGLTFHSTDDICYGYENNIADFQWTNFAPFEVGKSWSRQDVVLAQLEVRVDLSNSLPAHLHNSLRDIGTLKLGILRQKSRKQEGNADSSSSEGEKCVQILDENPIPYMSESFMRGSMIHAISFDESLEDDISSNPLVVVQVLGEGGGGGGGGGGVNGNTEICGHFLGSEHHHHYDSDSQKDDSDEELETVQILLQETVFVRPFDYYIDRLEPVYRPTISQKVFVTHFGHPVENATVSVHSTKLTGPPFYGVGPTSRTVKTNTLGIAEFTYQWNDTADPPISSTQRLYYEPQCEEEVYSLPVDGQLYHFYYCVDYPTGSECIDDWSVTPIVFILGLGRFDRDKALPPTWVDDVGPILAQYAQVAPIMKKILDLGNYTEVVLHKEMMKKSLEDEDFDGAGYMPVSRDLSTAKRKMILQWLQTPLYDAETGPEEVKPTIPGCSTLVPSEAELAGAEPGWIPPNPRCSMPLLFTEPPEVHDPRLLRILTAPAPEIYHTLRSKGRGHKDETSPTPDCSEEGVKHSLETALRLEWSTLPPYLTSLYSIKEGCNHEIGEVLRSVLMQEMLHVVQAANMLIAMGGRPLLDHEFVAPSYPVMGLPGGVLPGLEVTLEKLSLKHVHEVFMSIEVPEHMTAQTELTIGRFYNHYITDCINNNLSDESFQQAPVDKQVSWPWTPSKVQGDVIKVTDKASALEGVEMIVTQGEGSGLLNPNQIGNRSYAHFYKFEEIVCGRRLEKVNDTHYAYIGAPIPFDEYGVWPMRNDPRAETVPSDSNCYTKSRTFHKVYRSLLHQLQMAFDTGDSADVMKAVKLMEALKGHGKTVMWTKHHPEGSVEMCGPVWDYEWPM